MARKQLSLTFLVLALALMIGWAFALHDWKSPAGEAGGEKAGDGMPKESQQQQYDLSFAPKEGDSYAVNARRTTQWDYPNNDMKGTIQSEVTLHWRMGQTQTDGYTGAKGDYAAVTYQGKGVKQGRNFDHDIVWDSEKGYLKGQSSEADTRWTAKEIKQGVTLYLDNRGAIKPGSC